MNKLILIPIIIGASLTVAGGVIFGLAIANKSKVEPVTNTYDLNESFTNFNINTSISNVTFEVSTDGSKKVVCKETDKQYHDVKVVNDELQINFVDETKWYERIFNFDFFNREVRIYLPAETYGDLNIKASTGEVNIPTGFTFANIETKVSTGDVSIAANVTNKIKVNSSTGDIILTNNTVKELELKASTGNVTLSDVTVNENVTINLSTGHINATNLKAENLTINTSTGYISLKKSIINKHLEIKTDTGDVKFDEFDAETMNIRTDTGDVKGSLLSSKIFYVTSKTGKTNYPHTTTGGVCEIKTDTGDVVLTIKE